MWNIEFDLEFKIHENIWGDQLECKEERDQDQFCQPN